MAPSHNKPRADALLLVVDDREDNRMAIGEAFERQGYAVLTASGGREAIEKITQYAPDLVVCDLKMPDVDGLEVLKTSRQAASPPEFILLTAYGTVETAVDALKQGAFNYLTKPVNLGELRAQAEKAIELRRARRDARRSRQQAAIKPDAPSGDQYVFESQSMRELMAMTARLGPAKTSVLILGESGAGKEVVARALHDSGGDPDRPFVAVHCAALPETLLESELFGYERGAFTGADRQRIGRMEMADGGTLFLDEVGEIPLSMQSKLLRVLEMRELTRLGGRQTIHVDFRLACATNRNLEEEVARGNFREDLFYRINVVNLTVPSLTERREDIEPLFEMFLRRFAAEQGAPPPALTGETRRLILSYPWPGNVREVRNLAERLTIFAAGQPLKMEDFPPNFRESAAAAGAPAGAAPSSSPAPAPADTLDLQAIEKRTIEQALERFGGNRSAAAEALGISRRTLQRKLKEYYNQDDE